MSNNNELEEYKELSNNLRHYGNVQFAQLTLLTTVTAGLVALLFTSNSPLSSCAKNVLKWLGLIITIIFTVIIWSSTFIWGCFIKRAAKLGKILGYEQYSKLKGAPEFKWCKRPGTLAMYSKTVRKWKSSLPSLLIVTKKEV